MIAREHSDKKQILCREGSSKFFVLSGYFFLFSFLLNANAICQWKKIFQYDKSLRVSDIYFKPFSFVPEDGFLSFAGSHTPTDRLWRTLDGGLTWTNVPYPLDGSGVCGNADRIVFKNALEGWFAEASGEDVYRTMDGGSSWNLLSNVSGLTDLFYNKSRGVLLASIYNLGFPPDPQYVYSNDGVNFNPGYIAGFTGTARTIGITFTDDFHGIIGSLINGVTLGYTTDGGITWDTTNLSGEIQGPVGIQGTKTFFAISEKNLDLEREGKVLRSDDGGITWKGLYAYPVTRSSYDITGAMQYGFNMTLFFQTQRDGSEGIMKSNDSGKTFYSICGPINDVDTRFYVRDSFIYAGDKYGGLWLNTTGIGSNSTPQLTYNKLQIPQAILGCKQIDSAIAITFFDSCNNIQAKLVNASISGSQNFLVSQASPRTIHPNDSLVISYNPQNAVPDTSQLHLKFHLGWKDFDTTIMLFGAGKIPKKTVTFIPASKSYSAHAGEGFGVSYYPNKNISGKNLDSFSFDLGFDTNLLDYRSISTSIPGASVNLTPAPLLGKERVTIKGSNMTLDAAQPVVTITFMPMVSQATSTPITMSNLQLNGGDQNYSDCILSADTANAEFTEIQLCGDTTLRNYMNGTLPLKIISIRPNPAQEEILVEVENPVGHTQCAPTIFDAMGRVVFTSPLPLSFERRGGFKIDTKNLSGGVYLLRIGNASQSFVKAE